MSSSLLGSIVRCLWALTATLVALTSQGAMAAPVARCPFDNELTSLTREGLIYLRYALGLPDSTLVNATGFTATHARAARESIECASCLAQLDINGSGHFDPVDAQLIARFLAGLRGAALTAHVPIGAGVRNSETLVREFIEQGCTVPSPTVILAAGDIAHCPAGAAASDAAATLNVLRRARGVPVLTLGDNVYFNGTPQEFSTCFAPTWGTQLPRLRPSPGNHDYGTAGAAGYFSYFGRLAGNSNRGYYSFDVGDWHVVSLNSNIDAAAGSPQELWLRNDLANSARKCVLAYWHHPVFTSSPRGDNPHMKDIWRALNEFNADVVLTGHEHNYERFAKQTADGVLAADGIRQFIVGTGGMTLYPITAARANSEVRNTANFGVLKLVLSSNSYAWEFLPVSATLQVDFGSAMCNRQN